MIKEMSSQTDTKNAHDSDLIEETNYNRLTPWVKEDTDPDPIFNNDCNIFRQTLLKESQAFPKCMKKMEVRQLEEQFKLP